MCRAQEASAMFIYTMQRLLVMMISLFSATDKINADMDNFAFSARFRIFNKSDSLTRNENILPLFVVITSFRSFVLLTVPSGTGRKNKS